MKIAIFIDWFAPAFKAGGPIQSIINLVNQPIGGIEYRIICSNKDLDGTVLSGVGFDTWVPFNNRTSVYYNSGKRKISRILRELESWSPNLFFINGIYSFRYNFLPLVSNIRVKKIISARGMLHAGALSQKSAKKKLYLGIWKCLNIPKKAVFHATNIEEANFIKSVFGKDVNIFIAQNFPRVIDAIPGPPKKANHLKMISVGLISPMKNYLEVLEALRSCRESIQYSIYGSIKDRGYWQGCENVIKQLPPNITVQYYGEIAPNEVASVLEKAHVFVLPSKSENFGHAIVEALSAGKPVITSCNTPWQGLAEAKAGINVSMPDNYELSKAICFFAAMDERLFEEWSNGAISYAGNSIDLKSIEMQYKTLFSVSREEPVI